MTMTLHEAIVFVRDAKPGPGVGQQWDAVNFKFGVEPVPIDHAIASIMNAVASGALIPKADADLAVALAYQRAADQVRAASERCEEQARGFGGMEGRERQFWEWTARSLALLQEATSILALAPADALAEVQALKAERDEMVAEVHAHIKMWGDALRRAEAAEADVARLREALAVAMGGCDANQGAEHSPISIDGGKYHFCSKCGETLTKAQAKAASSAAVQRVTAITSPEKGAE